MFKWLAVPVLALACGCATPISKYSSTEYSSDNRDFNRVRVYGSAEFPDHTKFFGNMDLNSGIRNRLDLEKFAGRLRFVRPLGDGFGLTGEYKDGSGKDNNIAGAGFSYSPFSGMEIRAYPFRTDKKSQEVGFSFRKIFTREYWNPYVAGFGDLKFSEGGIGAKGEIQTGVKMESGVKIFLEVRYSDSDIVIGLRSEGMAIGAGFDF